jgi:anti-anti-sigma regulatory factor
MTLRITTEPGKNKTTIRVEGHFSANEVEDLQNEMLLVAAPVHLDLSGLNSADAEGVRALQSYAAQGVKLVGASPYIRQLLVGTSS